MKNTYARRVLEVQTTMSSVPLLQAWSSQLVDYTFASYQVASFQETVFSRWLRMASDARYVEVHFFKSFDITKWKLWCGSGTEILYTLVYMPSFEICRPSIREDYSDNDNCVIASFIGSSMFIALLLWYWYLTDPRSSAYAPFKLFLDKYPPYSLLSYTFAIVYPSFCFNNKRKAFYQIPGAEFHLRPYL